MNPKDQTLTLILQLTQLALVEIPNVAAIVALLRDHTKNFEAMLSEADMIETDEIGKLKKEL